MNWKEKPNHYLDEGKAISSLQAYIFFVKKVYLLKLKAIVLMKEQLLIVNMTNREN